MVARWLSAVCLTIGMVGFQSAQAEDVDPYHSELWPDLKAAYLGDDPVVYDRGIRVILPRRVEEPHSVPMAVKFGDAGDDIQEIVVIAEKNPIQQVMRLRPHRPIESLSLNIRLEESTPVRVAVSRGDGLWYVGSTSTVLMSSGGCSTPNDGAVAGEVGAIALKTFERVGGASRVKIKINHPMETGFASLEDGTPIPAYYIDSVMISDESGPLAELQTSAAMASDPTITLDLPGAAQSLRIDATDSEGEVFEYFDAAPSS